MQYKDSGVEWIGEIPENWNIKPIKYIAKTIAGGTPSTNNLNFWEGGNIPWLPSGMVQNNELFLDNVYKFITEMGLNNSSTKYIGPNSILVALTGATCGNISYLHFKATANQSVISIEPYSFLPKFIYYFLLSQKEQILFKRQGGAQAGINENDVKSLKIVDITFNYQKNIVNFLDKKTKDIEITIEKDKKLIELLEEKRVALINQVVTKGLNPDVPMKDSGVEWIGEIPENWDIIKSKRFCKIETGGTPKREVLSYWDKGSINWITSGEVNNEIINESRNKITTLGLNNSNAHIIPKNSIVMALSGQGQTKGRVAILNIDTCCSQSVGAFICNTKKLYFKYLFYYLKSRYLEIRGLVGDNLRDGLSLSIIGDITILLPPITEQKEISVLLDKQIHNINEIVNKVESKISLLEEYKESLIYNVVTGKVDVSEGVDV